jgi:AcrR family transcriptional regulator
MIIEDVIAYVAYVNGIRHVFILEMALAHRPRAEMIAETRAKLLAAGRKAFGTLGYAEASMDDFTAKAGLTRGALYHHFGDKKGLFEAVLLQIDDEMNARMKAASERAPTCWQGLVDECTTYIQMALEPEIQRIVFRDGPAVLGDPSSWPNAGSCVATMAASVARVRDERTIADVDPEAAARVINGAMCFASQWIANAENPEIVSKKAVQAFNVFLEGLLRTPA